jgi:hypothetical protein
MKEAAVMPQFLAAGAWAYSAEEMKYFSEAATQRKGSSGPG